MASGTTLEETEQAIREAVEFHIEVLREDAVDVLTAQSTPRRSETAYASSRYDYALNVLRLQRAA